jgi:hypothetical protein
MKQNLLTAVNENEKKAAEIEKEWINSKIDGVGIKEVIASSNATLNVHTSTEG